MPKLCVLSDSHGFIHPEIVAMVSQCDLAIHVGDIIDESTLAQLQPKDKLIAVKGNNDDHITWLNAIEMLEIDNKLIAIEHGHLHGHQSPSHDSLREAYPEAQLIIYGHTHKQVVDTNKTPWIINPGASGNIRNHGGAKCLIIDTDSHQNWSITAHIFA